MVVAGVLIVYASIAPETLTCHKRLESISRWIFGLGAVFFGLGHLTGVSSLTKMIPSWIPIVPSFWVVQTGIAFLLAGFAILTTILAILAAHLLAMMLVMFELALIPAVIAYPQLHIPWGSNGYNLAASGAMLVFASYLKKKSTEPYQS